MINVTLIAVGKLKEKYLRDAVAEYIKRLGAFRKIILSKSMRKRSATIRVRRRLTMCLKKRGKE